MKCYCLCVTSWKCQCSPLCILFTHTFLITTVAALRFSAVCGPESRCPSCYRGCIARGPSRESSGTLEISSDGASVRLRSKQLPKAGYSSPPSSPDLYLSYSKCFHGPGLVLYTDFFQWNKMCCTSCVWNEIRGCGEWRHMDMKERRPLQLTYSMWAYSARVWPDHSLRMWVTSGCSAIQRSTK